MRRALLLLLCMVLALLAPSAAAASTTREAASLERPKAPRAACTHPSMRLGASASSHAPSARTLVASRSALPHPRAGRRPSTDLGEAAGEAGWEGATHLAGNVRRLRQPGGLDLGGYRYSAFGQTLEDNVQDVVPPSVFVSLTAQPLRWKGMWRFDFAGAELYDARARMWSPALGSFLSVDEFNFHDPKGTLWGWPRQNPLRYSDPSGRWGDDSPAAQNWGPYAVQHLDDPVMLTLGAGGVVVYGGMAAPAVAPFVSTSSGIALWGTLAEMGPAGAFIAGLLSGTTPALVAADAGKPSLPGQLTGATALAGQCAEKAKQSNATFGGNIVWVRLSWNAAFVVISRDGAWA